MRNTHRVVYGITIIVLVIALGAAGLAAANNDPPSSEDIAFAAEVSDLMLNELFAALLQEFNETTPDNVEHGKQAISLLFNDLNTNMRLIGALEPLLGGSNNRPSNSFEETALQLALTGQASTAVERKGNTWFYRRSVPLSNFHESCVMCHSNFGPTNPSQWVGGLVLAVPIND
jgi:hypothetical protein